MVLVCFIGIESPESFACCQVFDVGTTTRIRIKRAHLVLALSIWPAFHILACFGYLKYFIFCFTNNEATCIISLFRILSGGAVFGVWCCILGASRVVNDLTNEHRGQIVPVS